MAHIQYLKAASTESRFKWMSDISKARLIKQQFGTRAAAGHLRNRKYSIEFTLWALLQRA